MSKKKELELLAPAGNVEIAIQAILHGADAVYMGASSHGARKNAANSLDDIKRVVEFAHRFRSRVYVTVNTIIFEEELKAVEKLCRDLYKIGVDALIVQDMALLRLDIPPIALHASTQCDIRTPEKAKFLQEVGFSQLVLARELTLDEIKAIVRSVDVPVECFVHGALCVSYSGRCHISCATTGRSANRGECSQLCRLPYTLKDANGDVISKDKYLLSLKDFNVGKSLPELIEAGVSSFKVEGRLKESDYVKNITAYYNRVLNDYINRDPDNYVRSSFGSCQTLFEPSPDKSFNRGFTNYFLSDRYPRSIASLNTPKSMGEVISDISDLHNGDGISFFDSMGIYQGSNINKVENGRIILNQNLSIPRNTVIHRTHDLEWQKLLRKETSVRKIKVDFSLDETGVTASDERGQRVRLPLDVTREKARKEMNYEDDFRKLGNTIYELDKFTSKLASDVFIPRSEISKLKRDIIAALDNANSITYVLDRRRHENKEFPFPSKTLDFRDNVANSVADSFYKSHGVIKIEQALELQPYNKMKGKTVMTTRHCVLRELGLCKKTGSNLKFPLRIESGRNSYTLSFNCQKCEMEVIRL
ncbi:MAG: U32 family peptidase [Muribaculaceae bacterium]|nr:U32 family peptidase [Muribaculaceae bacterium]MDE6753352.1 U32 family peptidase [Muribaculaceae bacterium]